MIIRVALTVAALAIGITAVTAQSDPIAARKAAMKAVGDTNRTATELLDGKQPFSVDAAKKVLATWNDSATKMQALFPDNSKTGDTNALPTVWENKADFNAKLAKFASDSKTAEGKITNLDTFKAEMVEVRKNCGACHTMYRKRT